MPCSYTDVNIHLTDAVDGSDVAGATLTVGGGRRTSPVPPSRPMPVGPSAFACVAGPTAYTATVPAQSGRAAVRSFSVPDTTTVNVNISLPRLIPAKQITVTLKDDFTKNPIAGATVQISGGPAGTFIPNGTTNAAGQYVFASVPYGTAYPDYTITAPAAGGRNVVTGTADSTGVDAAVDLFAQWTMSLTINVTVVANSSYGGAALANTDFVLAGGPAVANTTYTSDATGKLTIVVPARTGGANYTLTVPADGAGRLVTTLGSFRAERGIGEQDPDRFMDDGQRHRPYQEGQREQPHQHPGAADWRTGRLLENHDHPGFRHQHGDFHRGAHRDNGLHRHRPGLPGQPAALAGRPGSGQRHRNPQHFGDRSLTCGSR